MTLLSRTLNSSDKVEELGKQQIEKQMISQKASDFPAIPKELNERSELNAFANRLSYLNYILSPGTPDAL